MPDNPSSYGPYGYISNPLSEVVQGLLQGHLQGLQDRQQQNADIEAQTRQALGQQQIQESQQRVADKDYHDQIDFMNTTRRANKAGQVFYPEGHQRVTDAINQADATNPPRPFDQTNVPPTLVPGQPQAAQPFPLGNPATPNYVQPPDAPPTLVQPPDPNDAIAMKEAGQTYAPPPQSPQEQLQDSAKAQGGLWLPAK